MKKLTIDNFQERINLIEKEHEVLEYWDETHAFERSVDMRSEKKAYVFYDGPPFATGLPHYGHILASTIKDVIPRYWTMKGYRVDRVWGWDCHGIPIENMVEKELGLKGGKKGIEALGIDKFNDACRSAIFRFDSEWEKVIRRIGRWVDFKHSYKTMDASFMESVWWAFSELYKKDFIYEDRRIILYCPRCATPLSNFEIAMDNSYKDVEDNSLTVKFKIAKKEHEYLLAWTTTPWTLIGNVALAVLPNAAYVQVEFDHELLWLAEARMEHVFGDRIAEAHIVDKKLGKDLIGIEYKPLYSYMPLDGKKAHYVAGADFVSLDDGTGIVHTAAIFGEDDYRLAVQVDLPRVPTLDDQGKFFDFVTPLAGVFYKKSEAWVIEDLQQRNLLYRVEKIIHSYPFCYRCETPLYFNAVPAWFIDVQKMKPQLIAENEKIQWFPDYLKHGRFGKGLETAPDWNISRSRYWGTPMPIWKSIDVKENSKPLLRIISSIEELKHWAVDANEVTSLADIHREFIDDIEIWVDDAKTIKGKRIPEVFDCWVESGSMPYASIHYPFEHKEEFHHPAQFIAEYIAQTRAWFYTLHVMSVGLFGKHTFDNAVTTGTILAEDGAKMSKSKKNYPDPALVFEKYGVDALRFYLMSSVVMKAENLNFSENQVKDVYQKLISTVWNVFSYYKLYAHGAVPSVMPIPNHDMDRWIVSKTHALIRSVTLAMDGYDTVTSCRLIQDFVTDLSTWYLRRSRDRLKVNERSMGIFAWVLDILSRSMAPVTPFISELMYQNLHDVSISVHHADWPMFDESQINLELEQKMDIARSIVEGVHALRKKHAIPVKQPLARWSYVISTKHSDVFEFMPDLLMTIQEETNVRKWQQIVEKNDSFISEESIVNTVVECKVLGSTITVYLDTKITHELEMERKARELIREIQILRKEKGCKLDQHIRVVLPADAKDLSADLIQTILVQTVSDSWEIGDSLNILIG